MAGVHDVAAAIVERIGPLTTMKLQKLVYYCQAWHLARHREVLFDEEIQAWRDGPVVRDLYDLHKGAYSTSRWDAGNPVTLTADQLKTVSWVVETYGQLSPEYLSRITHSDSPWKIARGDLQPDAYSGRPISVDLIYEYYSRLVVEPDMAVRQAVANAALEGAELDERQKSRLQSIARGECSANEMIARLVAATRRA